MQSSKSMIHTAFGTFVLGASLCILPAAAQSTYTQERAACDSGQSGQSRADCLREAGAARNEARQGKLGNNAGAEAYSKNATARCGALPMAEREECTRRMQEGTVSGSVESGGMLREHRQIMTGETGTGGGMSTGSSGDTQGSSGMGSMPASPGTGPSGGVTK
jgi:hypothetical protein